MRMLFDRLYASALLTRCRTEERRKFDDSQLASPKPREKIEAIGCEREKQSGMLLIGSLTGCQVWVGGVGRRIIVRIQIAGSMGE